MTKSLLLLCGTSSSNTYRLSQVTFLNHNISHQPVCEYTIRHGKWDYHDVIDLNSSDVAIALHVDIEHRVFEIVIIFTDVVNSFQSLQFSQNSQNTLYIDDIHRKPEIFVLDYKLGFILYRKTDSTLLLQPLFSDIDDIIIEIPMNYVLIAVDEVKSSHINSLFILHFIAYEIDNETKHFWSLFDISQHFDGIMSIQSLLKLTVDTKFHVNVSNIHFYEVIYHLYRFEPFSVYIQ